MRQDTNSPYRTPDIPKGIGSYNWPIVVAGFLSLVAWNIAATQWVAHRFAYAQALGSPLFFHVYQPLAWIPWMLHYAPSQIPFVKNTVMASAAIVVIGCAFTMMTTAVLNIRHTHKMMKGNEDLRGSARWATKEDILRDTSLLTASDGVYIGGFHSDNRLHYLMHSGKEHFLAFAPTRSGKGVGLVIPTLLAWPDSVVVYDIKGENWAKSAGFRATEMGQYCLKFSPVEADSSRFNPLAEIRIGTFREISDAQNIAQMIVDTGDEGSENKHFIDEAASLVTGLILHVCYAAHNQNPNVKASLADVLHILTDPRQDFHDTLTDILSFPHKPAGHQPDPDYDPFFNGDTHPAVAAKVRSMLNKADREFSGVLSSATRPLSLFADPLVAKCTSGTDFTIQDLVNAARPASLYIIVPPSDRARLRPLVRLLFTTISNRLMEKMEFAGPENSQKNNKHRLLFLIDEFPSLKRMDVFADALSFMAGYGLKAYLIAQDIRQIEESYGQNESIVSNCHIRVAYAPNNEQTAQLLSRMTGTRTLQKANLSFSGTRAAPQAGQLNTSIEYVERPLLTPDEVTRIQPAQKIGSGADERIVAPGDMLIFVAGTRPIYGKQILYFNDPELNRRSLIPPPAASANLHNPPPQARGQQDSKPARRSAPKPSQSSPPVFVDPPQEYSDLPLRAILNPIGNPDDSLHIDLRHEINFLNPIALSPLPRPTPYQITETDDHHPVYEEDEYQPPTSGPDRQPSMLVR